jgi:hypothetical protein
MPYKYRNSLSRTQLDKVLKWLPLPPDTAHPYWDGRCFRCFAYGHRTDTCTGAVVCRACLQQGHTAHLCPAKEPIHDLTTPLQPRGIMGDTNLPKDRPESISVFLHDNTALSRELDRLAEGYIIDARFVTGHSIPTLNRDLSRALPQQTKYAISHLSSTYYLLMFNSHLTDPDYQTACKKHLTPRGYISFAWSPAVKSSQRGLGFKVWLDLADLPPHVWSLDELAVVFAPFGLILAHAPLDNVPSFERLRLVIATDNLSRLPKNVHLFLNGRLSIVPLVIIGWAREHTPFDAITDPTPSEAVYENMAIDLYAKIESQAASRSPSSSSSGFMGPQLPDVSMTPDSSQHGTHSDHVTIQKKLLIQLCNTPHSPQTKASLISILAEGSAGPAQIPARRQEGQYAKTKDGVAKETNKQHNQQQATPNPPQQYNRTWVQPPCTKPRGLLITPPIAVSTSFTSGPTQILDTGRKITQPSIPPTQKSNHSTGSNSGCKAKGKEILTEPNRTYYRAKHGPKIHTHTSGPPALHVLPPPGPIKQKNPITHREKHNAIILHAPTPSHKAQTVAQYNSPHDAPCPHYPPDSPGTRRPTPPQPNATPLLIDQYGTNIHNFILSPTPPLPNVILTDPIPTERLISGPDLAPPPEAEHKQPTKRAVTPQPTSLLQPTQLEPLTQTDPAISLRRSVRPSKKPPLLPGLIATPTKTKQKNNKSNMTKAIKQALSEAGLLESLQQEAINSQPLRRSNHLFRLIPPMV